MDFIFTEDFAKLITSGGKYVDKTMFLRHFYLSPSKTIQGEVLPATDNEDTVMLFTRPRRFGKTLTMSMIANFFKMNLDNPSDTSKQKALFANLAISKDTEFCDKYLGQYPVISISLKDIRYSSYIDSCNCFLKIIASTVEAYREPLIASGKLTSEEQVWLNDFATLALTNQINWSDETVFSNMKMQIVFSLSGLAKLFFKVYGKKTIILIDEYDVPLRFAAQYDDGTNHYYQKMHELITGLFSNTFKTQTYLEKGIITGCLRISHASIFTGVNNFAVYSVTDEEYSNFIGFTQQEVHQLLADANLLDHEQDVLDWYDGYNFAGTDMLCSWSVMNYCRDLQRSKNKTNGKLKRPKSYWNNTSQNQIIDDYLFYHGNDEMPTIQELLQRKEIVINCSEFTTYQNLKDNGNLDQILGLMLQTGYLTAVDELDDDKLVVKIPNNEIYACFANKINNLFSRNNETWFRRACDLKDAFFAENVPLIQSIINDMLSKFFSIRDIGKEKYYHIFLNTVLQLTTGANTKLKSEAESGDGYPDLVLLDDTLGQALIIELKQSVSVKGLEQRCQDALSQIIEKNYSTDYQDYNISMFGIAFFKKMCLVKLEQGDK